MQYMMVWRRSDRAFNLRSGSRGLLSSDYYFDGWLSADRYTIL